MPTSVEGREGPCVKYGRDIGEKFGGLVPTS
jgi:hypothetical protein